MSPAPKSEERRESWRPQATWPRLRERAELLAAIRRFFAERGVLEVETPLLSATTVTDFHLHSLSCMVSTADGPRRFYLQTSPEFAMKRLLASGSGPIYQICKAFRDDETGRLHNIEFTMLEWYRPGFDHHALMDEIDAFLGAMLGRPPADRQTYGELFATRLGIDPHRASLDELRGCADRCGVDFDGHETDRDTWLQVLLSHAIEPHLGRRRPTFVYDFPASQAALARLRPGESWSSELRTGDPPVAERFEVYVEGIELANGFHELADATEQRQRFHADLTQRRSAGLPTVGIDNRLLAALEASFPDCSGVALGVDRLAMLRSGAESLADVTSFVLDKA